LIIAADAGRCQPAIRARSAVEDVDDARHVVA
jgi:hypothetical protein